jgi:hypothetical protein
VGGKLKQHWREFKRGKPGQRFQDRYEKQRRSRHAKSGWRPFLHIALAIALFLVGVILLFIPGPAFLFLGISAGMMADHSRGMARALDWLEVKSRSVIRAAGNWWKGASALARSSLVGIGGIAAASVAYVAWQLFLPN